MNDLISVIIPAYNASTRIKTTLESIIAQDYPEIEIILVNDKSTDNTEEIAQETLKISKRSFKLIAHGDNKGVSASRNTGIENATGKYISFVDADDLLKENFLSELYVAVTKENCDIAYCGLVDRFLDGKSDVEKNHSDDLHIKPPITGENVILAHAMPSVCCCLYEADFIKKYNLRFFEGCVAGEDVEFTMKAMCRAKKVTFIKQCLYIYVHHSEMGSVRDNNTTDKKLLRYEHNTQAQSRTAEYISRYASSHELKKFADKILVPQSVIRLLTLHAKRKDKTSYTLLLHDKTTIDKLYEALTFYTFKTKPELFFKALAIKLVSGLYFRMRRC